MKVIIKVTSSFLLTVFMNLSFASSGVALIDIEIPKDSASLKRGAMIYYNVCRLCHDMKYISYQNLSEVGFADKEIDELRGKFLKSSTFTSTVTPKYSNELYGMVPPDLSVMAKARKHGPQYIYTLLTSFYEKSEGMYDNRLFPGLKMPDILNYSVTLNAAEKTVIENKAKDVSAFLTWASDPKAEERKELGIYVIGYFVVLSLMLYVLMKRVWSRLDPSVSQSLK